MTARGERMRWKRVGYPALIQEHGRGTVDCYKRCLERLAGARLRLTRRR